ncbi:CRISPR-associated helicase Cas3' [Alkaliphilus hydrothermalis]|uniref:CRISPR-associated endonuclease/helicase Cas3 n=1 Tax=Alkaliphilus hydrothermalis TaxID=1482730 RepID=A0ABS2NNI3_9FIRM|nr:CRISPR-associated helicase Cas3' [Alkaliphilus hydrothermalis]MBM7614503.1 CRISPR-associated endonuclease/helicase Cas3 [Alkaliphilus hydrothermalis]
MYFDGVDKIELGQIILNRDTMYAHVLDDRKETLEEHGELATEYLYKIVEDKQLSSILLNIENGLMEDCSDEGRKLYREMLLNTIYLHDIGKINCNFQYNKMRNKLFKGKKGLKYNNSNHSMLSSLIYLNHYFNKIRSLPNKKDKSTLAIFLVLNAYIISKHHGSLDSLQEFQDKLLDEDREGCRLYTQELTMFNEIYQEPIVFACNKNILSNIFGAVKETLKKQEENVGFYMYMFIYERLLASLLLSCDYYATSQFKNGKQIEYIGKVQDINKFYDVFKNTSIYKGIRDYQNKSYGKKTSFHDISNINVLRNELFLEAEENLLKNIDKNIFYLEAPTGSGKSNVGFNLSLKILEAASKMNKIFYVYPFNTLIEQNINTLGKLFGNNGIMEDIAVINSVVPIKTRAKKPEEDSDLIDVDYEKSLLDRQFLHYPMVLTTHVSMFNYLFGTSKNDLFPLYQLCNSVIILDEIQSYKNGIWKEIITFLNYYAEALNIKFIIMSATLPNLSKLIDQETDTVNLIEDREKYFSNPIFKDRVKLDFSLLEIKEEMIEALLSHVVETAKGTDGNILIEFITKKSAMIFFKKLIDYKETMPAIETKEILLITGDDNSIDRRNIIDKVKGNRNIILIATQVIEAGVDIDMDIGYKDISMLDAEEQFLGRINRSCLKDNCRVFFFNLDEASMVYKGDVRKEKNITLVAENIRDILLNKNFSVFYDYVLEVLNDKADKLNDNNFKNFITGTIGELAFTKVKERMTLIDESFEYSVFLNRTILVGEEDSLVGEEVWEEYVALLKDSKMGYSEKKVKLSKALANMKYFIYKVKSNHFTYEDQAGDIYYIGDGEKYFVNGKFDRENFDKGIGDFI